MASSSTSRPRRSYDVFLSFRGTDIRNNFLGHLYNALDQGGIFTYIDSEELRKGERISPALMSAIEESRVAIVVFSVNYASSPWCLEEVAKIMECKERRGLVVFPVFYKVEPCEVRTPRESYRKAMAEHEIKFGKDSEKVKRWKKALFDAGSLSGWHFSDGHEAGLIQHIVKEISTQLDRMPLDVAKYPVGIDSRVEELKTILNLRSEEDVLMIGLWGLGGVGKTTLAKAIYNSVFIEFQGSSFLERVRENSKNSKDLVPLQEKLLSEILLGKKSTIYSVDGGSRLIQDRLCNKKVLVILDDADDECQLNALARNCEWFGRGSRIIITTRDRHLLTSHGVDWHHMYEVKALNDAEALELFRKHAFQGNQKIEVSSNLVHSVLHYASGLPLALGVLGSFLCGRGEHEWESTLQKLAKSPDKKINDVLKVGYEGLEDYAKEIFLDIACFFKGRSTEDIKNVLDSCDFHTTIGVQILIERSLISEEEENLQMHDLIQLMGRDIVEEECRDDPGKRSRLWLYDDILDVLSRDVGTIAIKAIVLELPKPEEMDIGPHAFTNMRKLRLLILRNVHNYFSGPIHLPSELRWFEWPHCASIPEFKDGPKKLVGLDLWNSNIERVLKQLKDFENLKFLNFSECPSMVCMPDLDLTPNLEELDLHECINLERTHESIACHRKLKVLNLRGCSKLQTFPDFPNKNKSLRLLYLEETSIEELPASIENLISLEHLNLSGCKKLAILPSSIYMLQNLIGLTLDGCSKLIKFPKKEEYSSDPHTETGFPMLSILDLGWCHLSEVEFLESLSYFPRLKYLDLSGNNFINLPMCGNLYDLEGSHVPKCQQPQETPKIPGKSRTLQTNSCESLSRIPSKISDVRGVQLYSCQQLVRNGFSVNDWFKIEEFHRQTNCQVILPGEEMPKWLLPNKDGYMSFVASKGLYKKILGVAFCVVFRGKEKSSALFHLVTSVNHKSKTHNKVVKTFNLDHVWLEYMESKSVWTVNDFGPDDLCHFHVSIRAFEYPDNKVLVKKCGFRLICKSLENDLEILLQEDQLLDPALFYEVSHEDSPTSTEEESSSEREDVQDSETCTEEEVLNMANYSIEKRRYYPFSFRHQNVRPGREMPKPFVLVEDSTISFMASQDLYDKFQGLTLCVVLGVEDGEKEVSFDIIPHINGQRRNVLSGTLGSFDSDHTWFQFLPTNVMWGVLQGAADFGQFDESYLRFSLRVSVSGGTVKQLGYVLRCWPLEDDLKAVLEDDQLVNLAALWEAREWLVFEDVCKGLGM